MKSPRFPISVYVIAWLAWVPLMLMLAWAYQPDPGSAVEWLSRFMHLSAAGILVWGYLDARVQAGKVRIRRIVGGWLARQVRALTLYVRRLLGKGRAVHASIEGNVAAGVSIEGHPTMVAHAPGQGAGLEARVGFLEEQYKWLKKERDTAKVERGQMRDAIDELEKAHRKLKRQVSDLRVESLIGDLGFQLAALGWLVVGLAAEVAPAPIVWLLQAYP